MLRGPGPPGRRRPGPPGAPAAGLRPRRPGDYPQGARVYVGDPETVRRPGGAGTRGAEVGDGPPAHPSGGIEGEELAGAGRGDIEAVGRPGRLRVRTEQALRAVLVDDPDAAGGIDEQRTGGGQRGERRAAPASRAGSTASRTQWRTVAPAGLIARAASSPTASATSSPGDGLPRPGGELVAAARRDRRHAPAASPAPRPPARRGCGRRAALRAAASRSSLALPSAPRGGRGRDATAS